MKEYFVIGIGGFFGAISRGVVTKGVQKYEIFGNFPFAILTVNMIGCFFIGFLSIMFGKWLHIPPSFQTMVMVGFLGSFTTYSTFANQSSNLLNSTETWLGWVNMIAHILLGLFSIYLGRQLAIFIS